MNIVFSKGDSAEVLKTILDILSPIIVIGLFVFERYVSGNTRRKDLQIEWYYKMMIEPNLSKIDTFFQDAIQLYENSLQIAQAANPALIVQVKAQEMAKFSTLKRLFEINIIRIFYIRYFDVAKTLTDQLIEIEDTFTSSLDALETVETFSLQLNSKKSVFYEILFEPIGIKKK